MMVRDLAKHVPAGLPLLSSEGLYGIQAGGASSVVCGHDVLMRIIDHMKARGVPVVKISLRHQQGVWIWRRRQQACRLVSQTSSLHRRSGWIH